MNAVGANANGSVNETEYIDMDATDVQISHDSIKFVADSGKENHPVVKVSWFGAKGYCEYYRGRLPTEAEWEFAARGGKDSSEYNYSGSNTVSDVAWYSSNSSNKTHEVGTKNANDLGIHDMSGNVWEWCNDWYYYYYYTYSPQNNPQGPVRGYYRIIRGGGYSDAHSNCRVFYRLSVSPYWSLNIIGFRPAFPYSY